MSNYTSQNLGAGRTERIREGFTAGLRMVFTLCVPVIALYFLFPRGPIGLFMEEASAEAMKTGVDFLRIVSPFYLVVSIKLIADGMLRGAGRMREFMIDTFTDLILRVGLCIVFSSLFGVIGIWCAWPVGWAIGTALSALFCLRYMKSLR